MMCLILGLFASVLLSLTHMGQEAQIRVLLPSVTHTNGMGVCLVKQSRNFIFDQGMERVSLRWKGTSLIWRNEESLTGLVVGRGGDFRERVESSRNCGRP